MGTLLFVFGAGAYLLFRRISGRARLNAGLALGFEAVAYAACAGAIAIGAYALLIEPYDLEITHVKIPCKHMAKNARPIIMAQISDLHCDSISRLEPKLPDAIKNEHPDLIIFTGDAMNSADGLENFRELITRLKPIAPLVGVKGDWDFELAPFEKLGWKALNGHTEFIINGTKLSVVGCDSGASSLDSLAGAPSSAVLVLLYHAPDSDVVLQGKTQSIDLICCGHTHGGQIALPFLGPLITQSTTRHRFARGLNKIEDTWIYTNRGIGMEGHFPRMRLCARPELTIFELCPAG